MSRLNHNDYYIAKKERNFPYALLWLLGTQKYLCTVFFIAQIKQKLHIVHSPKKFLDKRPNQDGKSWSYSISSCKEEEVHTSRCLT